MTSANGRHSALRSCAAILAVLVALLVFAPQAFAEGTRDLVSNGGYRPYTERYNSLTLGDPRLSVMHVYLEKGETVYLGTSVANAKLYNTSSSGARSGYLFSNGAMGTSYSDDQLAYVNTADVYVAKGNYANIADAIGAGMTPGKTGVTLVDIDSSATNMTPGYIYDSTQEAGGVDISGTGTGYKVTSDNTISSSTAGYVAGVKTNANTFTAGDTGIYTVVYFSSVHNMDNPTKVKTSDTTPFAKTQRGGTIASWDLSVYKNGSLQTGRVFTSTLFINMGGNVLSNGVSTGSLYSDVYAVTDDGYQYKVDFNGMDPFGFVFFANNRGLLNTAEGGSSSLYHGVRSNNATLSDVSSHGISLNNTPYDASLDKTYNLFYEKPSPEALKALSIPTDPTAGAGTIDKFAFTGTGDSNSNEGYVGKGGTFSFDASSNISATSYEIDLDFSSVGGGTVVLGNTLVKGATNSIAWNGRDANGKVVPADTYGTIKASIKLKGGEIHFPLLDVEQNPFGIKISRLNGTDPNSTIYFNNSASNAGDTTAPWTLKYNWEVGSQVDATTGVDSSNGAMAFTNDKTAINYKGKLLGDGDMCALDVWAHYDRSVSLGTWSFSLVDTSFTVTKEWVNTSGTPAGGNPSVTMTLYNSNGAKVTTDVTGASITNPVTYDTSKGTTYKWEHLDPTLTYYVTETPLTGYTTANSGKGATVTGTVKGGYAQTVTNTYKPTTLKLTKVWNMNGSTETHPASVTLNVYSSPTKSADTHINDYVLDATNNWTVTITVDSTLTYYVYENNAPTGYTAYGDGKASGSATDGYTSTITNTFNSGDYMAVAAFKLWVDEGYEAYRPTSVQVTLKKDGVTVDKDALGNNITNPVTLNDANGWYYIWPALVAKGTLSDGYTLEETTPNGYTASIDGPHFQNNFGYVGLDNKYNPTTFTVTKTWDNGTDPTPPDSVTVQLQQSLDSGKTWADYGDAQTLDAAGKWIHEWSGLPSYDSKGVEIKYKAVETPIDGYTTDEGSVSGKATDGYSQTITNTYDFTKLTVTKTWNYGGQAEADRPTSVNIALKNGETQLATCVLNADNNWTNTFDGLDRNGTYSVVEEPVGNYATTYGKLSGSDSDGWTVNVTNTYDPTSFTATKIWSNGVNASQPSSVSLQLQSSSDGGTTYANYGDAVTVTSADSWAHTWKNLDKVAADGTTMLYKVVEADVSDYATTYGDVTGSADDGYAEAVTNTYDKTNLSVNKVWSDNNDAAGKRPSYVRVELFANGSDTGRSVILNADNSWAAKFDGLDQGVTYSVVETLGSNGSYYSAAGGTVTGSDADGWSATFTNTYHDYITPLTPSTSTSTDTTSGTTTPYTGDMSASLLMIGIIAVGGAAMLGVGALLLKRSRS
jgi:hypothetical protein